MIKAIESRCSRQSSAASAKQNTPRQGPCADNQTKAQDVQAESFPQGEFRRITSSRKAAPSKNLQAYLDGKMKAARRYSAGAAPSSAIPIGFARSPADPKKFYLSYGEAYQARYQKVLESAMYLDGESFLTNLPALRRAAQKAGMCRENCKAVEYFLYRKFYEAANQKALSVANRGGRNGLAQFRVSAEERWALAGLAGISKEKVQLDELRLEQRALDADLRRIS